MSSTPVTLPTKSKRAAAKRAKVEYMSSPHDLHIGKVAAAMAADDIANMKLCKRFDVPFDPLYTYSSLQELPALNLGSRLPEAESRGWEVCKVTGHEKNFYILRMSKARAAELAAEEHELDRQSRTQAGAIMNDAAGEEFVQGVFANEKVTDKAVTVQGSEPTN